MIKVIFSPPLKSQSQVVNYNIERCLDRSVHSLTLVNGLHSLTLVSAKMEMGEGGWFNQEETSLVRQ